MTHLVTRCPKCATAFRLTSSQLESARGSVRCGSCLHIFKAQEHLATANSGTNTAVANPIPAPTTQAKPIASTSKTSTTKTTIPPTKSAITAKVAAPAKNTPNNENRTAKLAPINKTKALEGEDDLLISDDMYKTTDKESIYEFDGFLDVNLQPKQNASLFDREIRYAAPTEKEHVDESWADNLLDNEDSTKKSTKNYAKLPNETKPQTGSKQQPTNTVKKTETPNHSSTSSNHKAPVFSFVNENNAPEDGSEFSDAFINATRASEPNNSTLEDQSALFAAGLFDGGDEFEQSPSTKKPSKNQPKINAANPSRAALLMNIIPAPIELTAKRMRNWSQEQRWLSLAILAVITLIFQIAYFKFDYFSRVEPYRSAYVFLCPTFNCKVPSLVDASQISAYNLVVRIHPEAQNALMVDAIILNKAPFEQPFPDLILAFSTVDDIPVTARRFTPKEYLGGELAGMTHIPISQPVHITLELADPGPDAVNYHMNVAP